MKSRLLDIFIIVLIIALGVYFFELVQGTGELAAKFREQQVQARSLIEEIGDAKEENHILFEKLRASQLEIQDLKKSMENEAAQNPEAPNIKIVESVKPQDASYSAAQEKFQKVPRRAANKKIITTQNFLIIGQNKGLADSIILAAIDSARRRIALVSIPRDLFVNGRKINEYNSLYGSEILKEKIEDITGLTVQKYFVMDFEAFATIIDALGGIDIYVEKPIYDKAFPDSNGNYTAYSVEAGSHHMNGEEALKYARSRFSTSDFDRALRQQQIIRSIQERVVNFDFLNNLDKVSAIYNAITVGIDTDITVDDVVQYLQNYQHFTIQTGNVLSTANLLYSTYNISGQYILLPKSGDFREIQEFIQELID